MLLGHMLAWFPVLLRKILSSSLFLHIFKNCRPKKWTGRAGNHKTQIDTLLVLCFERKKSGSLKSQVKCLTNQLADVRTAQEKSFVERQATNDTVAVKKVAMKRVHALTEEFPGV